MSHRIWFERPPPEDLTLAEGEVEVLGPAAAHLEDPFRELVEAEAAIVGGTRSYGAEVMDRAPLLRAIARTGTGCDRVDLEAATARGIAVCNTPDAPSVSTAEHALALLLAVAKKLGAWQGETRAGGEDFFGRHLGWELAGKTLGVVGLGRIGSRVARLGAALGMEVLGYDPYLAPGMPAGLGVRLVESLEELLATSHVVSLHAPLTEETRGMLDRDRLALMRRGAILVNVARGGLVDHQALLEALESGQLGGAGLDVTEPEPLPPSHPLLARADVVVTPHVATATDVGRRRIHQEALHQALQVLRGERPPHLVNPEVWGQRRTMQRREA